MRLRQKPAEGQSEAQAYRRLPFTSPVQGYLDNPGCGLRSIADSGPITNYFARASATPGKKAHFCDGHHIAGATATLVSHSPGTAVWYSLSIIPPELGPANAGFLCVVRWAIGSIPGGGWG